ncbi:MAG: hypothetical protein HC915_08260 [Anaerolineae bacterium]|nr:hypothetical protein [Anaerolineae bacterium]
MAASLGKEGRGIIAVNSGTVGLPHDYDDDRAIVYLRLDETAPEQDAAVRALWEAGHPVLTLNVREVYDVGGEFLRWAYAVVVAGHLLGVNPFDEPDTRTSKTHTQDLLSYAETHGKLPTSAPYLVEDDVELYINESMGEILEKICAQRNYSLTGLSGMLAAHISFARSGDYIALLAYLNPEPETDALLHNIQRRLRHATTRAVTLGYGPRYLHLTGQMHKGGPETGLFIFITAEDRQDLPIPGKGYTFGTLKQAQALGDLRAIRQKERPVVHLHIKGDVAVGLAKVLRAIEVEQESRFKRSGPGRLATLVFAWRPFLCNCCFR